MPHLPPSRPSPDALTPPNGAWGAERQAVVHADDAEIEGLRDPECARQVAGPEVGGQAERGAVGLGHGLGVAR